MTQEKDAHGCWKSRCFVPSYKESLNYFEVEIVALICDDFYYVYKKFICYMCGKAYKRAGESRICSG